MINTVCIHFTKSCIEEMISTFYIIDIDMNGFDFENLDKFQVFKYAFKNECDLNRPKSVQDQSFFL